MRFARTLAAVTACALVTTWVVTGQSRPDFSGTWVVDALETPEGGAEGPGDSGGLRGPGGAGMGGGMRPGGGSRPEGGSRQGGRPPMARLEVGQKVVIKQTAERMILTTKTPDGDQMVSYALDGRESTNMVGPATVKSKTKWEGATLVTDSTARFEGPNGQMSIKRRDVRSLEDDGETMIVRTTTDTPRGKMTSAVIYRRAG